MSSFPSNKLARNAATLAMWLFAIMALMQVTIALGITPVTIVWGGVVQNGLTVGLRFASIAAAAILCLFGYVVQQRIDNGHENWVWIASWLVTAYMVLNTIGNSLSSNWFERTVFTSVTAILAVCCAVVSLSRPSAAYTELDV